MLIKKADFEKRGEDIRKIQAAENRAGTGLFRLRTTKEIVEESQANNPRVWEAIRNACDQYRHASSVQQGLKNILKRLREGPAAELRRENLEIGGAFRCLVSGADYVEVLLEFCQIGAAGEKGHLVGIGRIYKEPIQRTSMTAAGNGKGGFRRQRARDGQVANF